MLSSSLDILLKASKTTYPQKAFAYDCVTLYNIYVYCSIVDPNPNLDPKDQNHQNIIPEFSERRLFLLQKCNMAIFYSYVI